MKTFSTLSNLFISLSNNSSLENEALGKQQINDAHRYLLQKYFNNEGTSTTSTVGAMNITLNAVVNAGATTGTLTTAWTYPSVTQSVTFSNNDVRQVTFINGSVTITWVGGLSSNATADIVTQGAMGYFLPALYSKMKTISVTLGTNGIKYTPTEILTRKEWDLVTQLPYASDIPNYYFIYDGYVNLFPIPSSTGNLITMNYKFRTPDLALADYSTGTITATTGSQAITGAGTSWLTAFLPSAGTAENLNLWIKFNAPLGDGNWYQISSIASATALTLVQPYQGTTSANITFTIGQMPLLLEDFHDLLVYRPLSIYYSSINSDPTRASEFKTLYNDGIERLDDYSGSKSVNVDLGEQPQLVNPNLFFFVP